MINEELIEKHFSGKLSAEEQVEFDRLLREDSEFKEEYQFQKDLKAALIQNQKKSVKATLQEFEKELSLKEKKKKNRFWMIAASVVVLLGLGFFFYQQYEQKQPENLFATNFQPYRNIVNPVVRGEVNESIEKSAFIAYENGDYYKAINLFSSVHPKSYYIDFYKAMSLMAVDKNMEAIELLNAIVSDPPQTDRFKLAEKARWYLALAYLKSSEVKKARELLQEIVQNDQNSFKKEAAVELLDDLD